MKKWLKKRRNRIILIGAVVLVLLIILLVRIRMRPRGAGAMEEAVATAEAQIGDISTTINGTGSLESGQTETITLPTSIVIDEIKVSAGDTVKKGETLATVKESSVASTLLEVREDIDAVEDRIQNLSSKADDSDTTEYLESRVLHAQLSELEDTQSTLETLLNTLRIESPVDGTVGSDPTSGSTSEGSLSTQASGYSSLAAETGETDTYTLTFLDTAGSDEPEIQTYAEETTYITSQLNIPVTAPVTGATPLTSVDPIQDGSGNAMTRKGSVTWDCTTKTFLADTDYTATIILEAADGYLFDAESVIPVVDGATVIYYKVMDGGQLLYVQARFAATTGDDGDSASGQQATSGDGQNTTDGVSGGTSAGGLGTGAGSGSASAGSIGSGSASSTASGTTTDLSQYSISEETLFSIASGSSVVVNISVDELDILSVEEGQKAVITLDALEDEEFEGEITKVSAAATSTGGSVKYGVEISLDQADGMLLGMSASATINVKEVKNAVLIPVSALQESGETTYVYTKMDRNGSLSGEVEVTTGLSNEQQVQITSGLSAGDQVYYPASESTEDSDMGFPMMGGGQGGGLGGDMGGRPDEMGGER